MIEGPGRAKCKRHNVTAEAGSLRASAKQSSLNRAAMDCFVAYAPRNDGRRGSRRGRRPPGLEPFIEIAADRRHQRFDFAVKEMIGAGHDLLLDHNALLRLELLDQIGHVSMRHHGVFVAMDNEPRRRAGREERKVVEIGRRCDRDETLDLGSAHQKLHANPGAERKAGDPATARLGIDRLRPVQRRGGIRQFTDAVIETALATPNAAKVETQRGKAPVHEGVIELIDDLVIHRTAELWMRVQHDADRSVLLLGRMITAFDAAGRTCENHFGHCSINLDPTEGAAAEKQKGVSLTLAAAARKSLNPRAISELATRLAGRHLATSSTSRGTKSKHNARPNTA